MSNFYDILGIEKTSSCDEIKRAYKKLALIFHPDKNKDPSCEDTFKTITQAYNTLSDPVQRNMYDATIEIHDLNSIRDWGEFFEQIMECMKQILQKVQESMQPIIVSLPVTLEDLYHRRIKKIIVKVKRRNSENEIEQQSIPFYISLCNYEREYIFEKMGDDPLFPKFSRNDVKVILKVEEHPQINIDQYVSKYDMYYDKHITLYEHYFKHSFTINIFGKDVDIPYNRNNKTYFMNGYGLPYYDEEKDCEMRGDLYVYFHVDLPPSIDDTFEDVLKKLFHKL